MFKDNGNGTFTELTTGDIHVPTSKAVIEFIAQGNTPLPADPTSNPAIILIDAQLADIDKRSIRPIRENDAVFLATLTSQAIELRAARSLLPLMV